MNAFHLCIAGGQMFNGMRSVIMSIAEIVSSMAVIQSRNTGKSRASPPLFQTHHLVAVHGHFKDIHGTLVFDQADPGATSVEATIEAAGIWTGETARDAHLKSADFLDVEIHPKITFAGKQVELAGADEAVLTGKLTIRGITRTVPLQAVNGRCTRCSYRMAWIVIRGKGSSSNTIRNASHT